MGRHKVNNLPLAQKVQIPFYICWLFFDVVPFFVVELTAQFVSKEGSQIATVIDQKLRVGYILFLG